MYEKLKYISTSSFGWTNVDDRVVVIHHLSVNLFWGKCLYTKTMLQDAGRKILDFSATSGFKPLVHQRVTYSGFFDL